MVEYSENFDEYRSYLNDESNIVKNGYATRIYFPRTTQEMKEIVLHAINANTRVTISGGGTGISGGRVPLDGWLIATDKMNAISEDSEIWIDLETNLIYSLRLEELNDTEALFTVPVSMTVKAIQNYVREKGWFYPPDPTERTAFIGGNISTNASGARSFKYQATRKWIQRVEVIMADGEILNLDRGEQQGIIEHDYITLNTSTQILLIPRPRYKLPLVTKHVAGPVIQDDSHPIDLFIGSNGIFGFITQATLKLIRPPIQIFSIFAYCDSEQQALDLIQICQNQRKKGEFPIPMSVEFFDEQATKIMRNKEPRINEQIKTTVMLEQDIYSEVELEQSLEYYSELFLKLKIPDTDVALSFTENEHHKYLRHWVAEYVIGLNRNFGQSLIVTDYSVPEEKFKEFFYFLISIGKLYVDYLSKREKLEEGNPGYTLFGHVGDCHPHLTLLPRTSEEAEYAMELVIQMLTKTVELGGSIASEHGLGKKFFGDKIAFWYQYGDLGIEEVTKMKSALDPHNLLCPNNLIIFK